MDYRLKHLLKKSALLSQIGYSIRESRTRNRMRAYRGIPTDPKKILFASGRYCDSMVPVAEYLHATTPDLQLVWAYRSGDERFLEEYPPYIRPVLFESGEYYRELATSAAWVFNVLVPQGTIKRKDQLYIQVWHGDKPFKKIGAEAAENKDGYRRQSRGRRFSENELCDYFVTGSERFIGIWERSFGYRGKVIRTGLPRNDVLLKKVDGKIIRDELQIRDGTKILLYAPTFRDHIVDNSRISSDINLSEILDAFQEKDGGRWICLKRSHGGKQLILDAGAEDPRILDVSQYRDMTNLMLTADVLITDYSSCAGDFAFTGRPVLLYQDDIETYQSRDRSLIFDMAETPFYTAHTMDELKERIRLLQPDDAAQNDKAILELYQSTQTDHSTEDVAGVILEHLQQIKEK